MEINVGEMSSSRDNNVDVIVEHYENHLLVSFKSRAARSWFISNVIRGAELLNGKLVVPIEYEDAFDFMMTDADFEILDEIK